MTRQTYPKRDSNQKAISQALEAIGAQVYDTSAVGDGYPDLTILFRGRLYVIEVKAPGKLHNLTPAEMQWWAAYQGPGFVTDSPANAFEQLMNLAEVYGDIDG